MPKKDGHFDLSTGQMYDAFVKLPFAVKNHSKNFSKSLFTIFTVVCCPIVHFSFALNIECSYGMMMMMMIMNCFCGMVINKRL